MLLTCTSGARVLAITLERTPLGMIALLLAALLGRVAARILAQSTAICRFLNR